MSVPASLFNRSPIEPRLELGAYEHLWLQQGATFKTIAELFKKNPEALPKDLVDPDIARETAAQVLEVINGAGAIPFGIRVNGAAQYPARLRDAIHPIELLYYRGFWDLAENDRAIAIVGSRNASPEGIAAAAEIASALVEHGYIVVSGLAAGIDTSALEAAIGAGGRTIAVIGTPITDVYPKQNSTLQEDIAKDHLLISQVPILRYKKQNWRTNRFFFPERNKTMSALTKATVIVEAGESSGTLVQARAAIAQGRTLFIAKRCFENPSITWPAHFVKKGAIIVNDMDDIKWALDGI